MWIFLDCSDFKWIFFRLQNNDGDSFKCVSFSDFDGIQIISDEMVIDLPPSITVSEELSTPIDPDDDEQYFKHFGVNIENQTQG